MKSTSVTTHSTAPQQIMLPTFHKTGRRSPNRGEERRGGKKPQFELPFKMTSESQVINAASNNLTFFFSLCGEMHPPSSIIYLQHNLLQSPDLIDLPLFAQTLRKLDLSHNSLDYLPDVFQEMRSL